MLGQSGRALVAALLVCAGASASAQTSGIVAAAEGGVVLVRGTTTYTATPGVAVRAGDMLAADPKGQVQIEFDDGAILNLARRARFPDRRAGRARGGARLGVGEVHAGEGGEGQSVP